jgi:hypothetical protein
MEKTQADGAGESGNSIRAEERASALFFPEKNREITALTLDVTSTKML